MLQVFFMILTAGIACGLSLFFTEKALFIYKKPIIISVISIMKLLFLSRFFYIMLKSNQIHPIILITSFLITYWFTIFIIQRY